VPLSFQAQAALAAEVRFLQEFSLPRFWVPHISLVFREMWDSTELDSMFFTFSSRLGTLIRKREIQIRGIPHLAKNERDMGPEFVVGKIPGI
jgi:hypothetical protein